jgi:UDP-2,4-diacetamido-2,4,6-trideoxy-beta-L-altropyranose hydrolase
MILFRCDADPTLGMGHLMRCRTLASALVDEGQSCVLVGPARKYKKPGDDAIFSEWISMPFEPSPAADAGGLVELLSVRSSKAAVVDDYRVDDAYQMILRAAGVSWLQFDCNPKLPLWANLVLNPSPEAEAGSYEHAIRTPETKLLLGPQFAMLRREFISPATPLPPSTAGRILVTFGGGDDRGGVLKTLQTLLPALPDNIQFLVVSGKHNPRNTDIAEWIKAYGAGRAQLHVEPTDIAPLISTCSLAVMAGGGTTYEVNFCGLPMLLIAIADNQVAHSKAWQKAGAAKYLGRLEDLDPSMLLAETRNALDANTNDNIESGYKRLVDGRGRARVARLMMEQFAA